MRKIYGLIGYPVKHSLSPAMHNAAFKHLDIDAEYRLFKVKPQGLEDFFKVRFFEEKICGVNITIPHKEASIKHMDLLSGPAQRFGAINTVTLQKGKLKGYNTDITGFIRSLEDLDFNAASKKAIIFGAGGAARAVSFGLGWKKIKRIILVDVDSKKAAALAGDLTDAGCDAAAVEYDKKSVGELVLNSDLLVNATPCGMKKDDPELISPRFLHNRLSVFDLIYNPGETPLVNAAKKNGLQAINGISMLLYQGAAAFELWTGQRAPIEVMREALINSLEQI